MNRARSFFYACLGILCIVVAYHLGAQSAGAQAPGNPVVAVVAPTSAGGVAHGGCVVTANGDVCAASSGFGPPWSWAGNVFGSATPAQGISIGQLKAKYATPAPAVKP